ncbi:MAG TPA: hypothetical protein VJ743_20190 [Albitalea sp.]|nr:hypothetical protein [Albitalea sp.]
MRVRRAACVALLGVGLGAGVQAGAVDAAPPGRALEFGGSLRTLLVAADAESPASGGSNGQLANRLRLRLAGSASPALSFKLEHDTELALGSQGEARLTQRLFRAYAQFSGEQLTATLGRQRIPMGVGRLWSTLDMLNPVNPQQIERDEFVGVDALLIERGAGALSRASLVFAPDPAHRHDRWAGQWRRHLHESDLTLTLGRYWQDRVAAIDVATQWGDAGLRGEFTFTAPQVGSPYRKLLVGADVAFASTLTLGGEIYLSDQRAVDRAAQRRSNPQLVRVQPSGRAYAGITASRDLAPPLKASMVLLANLGDRSGMAYPALAWSLGDDSVLSGGAQFFFGRGTSEYGRAPNLVFLRYQRFF